jgi:hypothetical protein
VTRIDPETGKVIKVIKVGGGGEIHAIAIGRGRVWVSAH